MINAAFLFPGQGAQVVGMGRQLVEELPAARELFRQADEVLGYSLSEICFNGPQEKLDSTIHSQPALFVASLAALEKLRAEHSEVIDRCMASAGLSLGEYTAMVFAGSLTFEEGLRVVQRRGEAMQAASEQVPSGMASVIGLEREQVEAICEEARLPDQVLQVANLLCPGNIAISGHRQSLERAAEVARKHNAMRVVPLSVSGAFHTELMRPAVPRLAEALSGVDVKPPKIPVISNVDALPHEDPGELREILVNQVCSLVQWQASVEWMIEQGVEHFFEIGPGNVLAGTLKRISRKMPCQAVPA